MKIQKGDKVIMMAGKDRGKSAKVLNVDSKLGRVVVDGLNMTKKSMKPKKQGEKGQIVSIPMPVDISNIQIVCSSCGKPTRVGTKIEGENKKRYCKKCNATV